MSVKDLTPGAVLRVPGTGSFKDRNRPHNCVVAAETKTGDLILVPMCSPVPGHDKTCMILPAEAVLTPQSDKPLIVRASFAAYYEAKLVPKKQYITRVNTRDIECLGHITPELLAKIQKGLTTSDETEPFIITAYKQKL